MRYNYRHLIGATTFFLAFNIITPQGTPPSNEQTTTSTPSKIKKNETNRHSELDISSDEIVLNSEGSTTTAVGNVKIEYKGYHLSARDITFNHKNHRIIASGNIKLIEPDKRQIHAEYLDITDDFTNGIIKNLTIKIPADETYLTASSAQIIGQRTIFDKGTYTACSSCSKPNSRPPFWIVKSKRAILNRKTHTIRLEKPYLEIFGNSIFYFPLIEIPDETVVRNGCFLTPLFSSGEKQRFGVGIPYYLVISDNSDATFTFSPHPKKGILGEMELRKYFHSGKHTLHAAYMYNNNVESGEERHQAMLASIAEFEINPIWNLGWHLKKQTSGQLSYNYYSDALSKRININQIYLTGTGEKNSFDMRALHYHIQEPLSKNEKKFPQANIYPLIDYRYVDLQYAKSQQISITGNITAISRAKEKNTINQMKHDSQPWIPNGINRRLSIEADWRKKIIGPLGILFTPIANIRGDLHYLSFNRDLSSDTISNNPNFVASKMLTAGLDIRYPIVAVTQKSRHILEGIAQVYAATDEKYIKTIPNEDSHSLVLNSTSLFTQNRFSGFDRIEGGNRTNLGIRYIGSFNNLFTINGVIGRSIHILGTNSFSIPDSIGIGQNSGLEDKFSDYAAAVRLSLSPKITFSTQTLINPKDWSTRRTDTTIDYTMGSYEANISYTHIPAYPLYAYDARKTIQSRIKFKINDVLSADASLKWNMRAELPSHSIGLAYQNDCATVKIIYKNESPNIHGYKIQARLSLRTIGDFNPIDIDG
ncbi:LPS assembly protein LptD [Candidatus Liberibacter asiaticus]